MPVFDLAIVGSGFGGSLLAMIARRLGRSVVLLERGRHPRFAIGESSTPLANLLLEEMAIRYETARRLGRPELAGAFLMSDHPRFGPEARACCEAALNRSDPAALIERIFRTIEPIDVAGLGDRRRRSWYPVKAEDLLKAAGKLGATQEEIQGLLRRSGFW
jgi:hypothetical protein